MVTKNVAESSFIVDSALFKMWSLLIDWSSMWNSQNWISFDKYQGNAKSNADCIAVHFIAVQVTKFK